MENVNFLHIINRLKTVLVITKDKEVAEVLGLKETALNVRKKRDSFPEKELRALAQKRPELGIDVEYVLTGITTEARARLDAKQARISRAVDDGYEIDDIRDMERLATGATEERLRALRTMLSQMQPAEFDPIFSMATVITNMRRALAQTAAVSESQPQENTP